ncbi:unnamed protein product [Spirodela intermedia]|uniref:Uncharacterized protein n=1 Tax=Spirodela intermedia TaxID=51605 RepID=A0A7I8JHK7_SPIIN|nr:unnamed protein product [Spirodela intermedia]CAA6669614.1 unnamed protein product [Spirodela intermedia]
MDRYPCDSKVDLSVRKINFDKSTWRGFSR